MSRVKRVDQKRAKKVTNEKPVSLHGVNFKKLMRAFLQVKPDEEKKEGGKHGKPKK